MRGLLWRDLADVQDVIVIDTREPDEAANNPIPATVNVPLSRLAEVFDPNFHPGIFQRVCSVHCNLYSPQDFGFNKPSIDQKLIFLDRSGKNAPKAVEIVKGLGYPNARGVSGGTQEWNEKQAKEKK